VGLEELVNSITTLYILAGIRHNWDFGPVGKVLLEPGFVTYVEAILEKHLD
jgi:hypothetical protein